MDFENWDVDLAAGEARHESGCVVRVEGDPANPSSVDPTNFPKSLSFLDQARLLRCGVEALAKASQGVSYGADGQDLGRKKVREKSKTAQALEEKARLFAENPDKPKRSVLSLKRRKPAQETSD